MKLTRLLCCVFAAASVLWGCDPTTDAETQTLPPKPSKTLSLRSLSGFVVEDSYFAAGEYYESGYFMLLKKKTPWRDVVKDIQKELPGAEVIPSKITQVTTIIAKSDDLVVNLMVGAGNEEPELLETAKLRKNDSRICAILVSVRKVKQ